MYVWSSVCMLHIALLYMYMWRWASGARSSLHAASRPGSQCRKWMDVQCSAVSYKDVGASQLVQTWDKGLDTSFRLLAILLTFGQMHCPSSSSPWTRPVHLTEMCGKIANSQTLVSREPSLVSYPRNSAWIKIIKFFPLYREASWATGHLRLATQRMKGDQSQWTVTHCGCAGREDG